MTWRSPDRTLSTQRSGIGGVVADNHVHRRPRTHLNDRGSRPIPLSSPIDLPPSTSGEHTLTAVATILGLDGPPTALTVHGDDPRPAPPAAIPATSARTRPTIRPQNRPATGQRTRRAIGCAPPVNRPRRGRPHEDRLGRMTAPRPARATTGSRATRPGVASAAFPPAGLALSTK